MMCRVVVLLVLLSSCASESETDRIVKLLGSKNEDDNRQGLSLAYRMPRPAKTPTTLTPDEERVVRAMRDLLARSRYSDELKGTIASNMQKLRVPGSQPELVACAQENATSSARSCVVALEAAGDPANADGVIALLADPKNVMTFFEDDDTPEFQLAVATRAAVWAAAAFGDAAIPPLSRLVAAGKEPARALALQALERFESDAAALAAAPALTDANRFVRFNAATVIAKHPKHRELLRPLLDDPGHGVRRIAREALGLPPEPEPPEPAATDATSHEP